jgi:hypothetical protein
MSMQALSLVTHVEVWPLKFNKPQVQVPFGHWTFLVGHQGCAKEYECKVV